MSDLFVHAILLMRDDLWDCGYVRQMVEALVMPLPLTPLGVFTSAPPIKVSCT